MFPGAARRFGGILYLLNRPFSRDPKTYTASRMTSGNLLFPVQIAVFPGRVVRHKPKLFGHLEDSIGIDQIASVKMQAGVMFADVVIDTTGGSPPVVFHGHSNKDAETSAPESEGAGEAPETGRLIF